MAKTKTQEPKVKKERFKTIKQVVEVWKMVAEIRPKFKLWSAIAFFSPLIAALVVSIITGLYAVILPLGLLAGFIAFMILLNKNADSAGYERIDGQPGASGAILNQVKFANTSFEEEPVAVDPKTYDLIFRGTGRAGIFLIVEGPRNRTQKMVQKEMTRTKRLLPNVPIHVINVGDSADQVPLKELKKKVIKTKITLSKAEALAIRKRLSALGGMRLPIPKGIDPNKAQKGTGRRALRGK